MGNARSREDDNASFLNSTASHLLTSNVICGNIFDAIDDDPSNRSHVSKTSHDKGPTAGMILPGELCHSSKSTAYHRGGSYEESVYSMDEQTGQKKINPTSALFARALISEVTDNPRTMPPVAMAAREKRLLKAQDRARRQRRGISALAGVSPMGGLNLSFTNNNSAGASRTDMDDSTNPGATPAVLPPNQLSENRAQLGGSSPDLTQEGEVRRGKHTITIGLSLSRRHSTQGHPDTVTRQTAFDFNELQDRAYKYVSSTDSSGWRAGGGEKGGNPAGSPTSPLPNDETVDGEMSINTNGHAPSAAAHKVAAPDTVHIPIIHIDAASPAAVDQIISALARGEVFIPHMSILPEALSVNGVSPPDLVVRFGCERNDDLPPDEWPNWCLEFMHNQLYEYFLNAGARWTKRPFQITLAKKVRWRTVKHMNKFFAHSERVINAWREKGPQYLNPQLSYIEGGATPEEVSRPHGIYLLRNGRPTNYFAPNFEPPYTTKMTRSLLMNVIGNSWDKKRRDWTSEPIPRSVTPAMLIATVCGCGDGGTTGFIASDEAMEQQNEYMRDNLLKAKISEVKNPNEQPQSSKSHLQTQNKQQQQPLFRPTEGAKQIDKEANNFARNPSNISLGSRRSANMDLKKSRTGSMGGLESQFQNDEKQNGISNTDAESVSSSGSGEMRGGGVPVKKSRSGLSITSQKSADSRGIHVQQRQPDTSMPSESSSTFSRSKNSPGRRSPKSSRSPSPFNEKTDYTIDDIVADVGQGHDRSRISLSPKNLKTHNNSSPPASEAGGSMGFGGSVGESATTVPISNQWPKAKEGRDRDRAIAKRLGELEDALRRQKLKNMEHDEIYNESDEDSPRAKPKSSKSKKKEKKDKEKREKKEKKKKDKEKSRQVETQEQPTSLKTGRSKDSPTISYATRRNPTSVPLSKCPSNNSLDYSMDSATIASGQFTADGSLSVGTAGNQSLLSYVTRSTIHTQLSDDSYRQQQQLDDFLNEGDEEDDNSMENSVQSTEDIPSDADLFAIGWAKALDESSGSYYYFTLDRSKIVWENPLIEEDEMEDEEPIPSATFSN